MTTVSCAYCERPAAFVALVSRDGHELGPKVAICSSCVDWPMELIWQRIAQPSPLPGAFKPIHLITSFADKPGLRVSP